MGGRTKNGAGLAARVCALALASLVFVLYGAQRAFGASEIASAPAVTFDSVNDSQDVYFEGAGGSLVEVAWTPSTDFLALQTVLDAGSLGSGPAVTFDSVNDSQDVYFEGPDGSLRERPWTPSTGWLPVQTVLGAGSLGSAPAVTFDSVNDSQDVYFEGPDASLREVAWTPGTGFMAPRIVIGPPPAAPTGVPPLSISGSTALTPPVAPARPRHLRQLRVKIVLSWRWRAATTWLVHAAFGRLPRHATVTIVCRGHGCPRRAFSAVAHRLGHRLETSRDPAYRAGDRLLITVSAPGFAAERAAVRIRRGRLPAARLLSPR